MKRLFYIALLCVWICFRPALSQEEPRDTVQKGLPRLDLPEITIIGKKAITLPFASKGEIYDVNVYQAPMPDSALIGERFSILTPSQLSKSYRENRMPWNISADGSLGSHSTWNLNGYFSCKNRRWGANIKSQFYSTRGHVSNASAHFGTASLNANYLLDTDNDILKELNASAGLEYGRESFGIFGIHDLSIERKLDNFVFGTRLESVNRTSNIIDLEIKTKLLSLTDHQSVRDSGLSVVIPQLRAAYSRQFRQFKLSAELSYISTSADYHTPVQTPSVLEFSTSVRWRFSGQLFMNISGFVADGFDMRGDERVLIRPGAVIQWLLDPTNEISFWFRPRMHMSAYDENLKRNPYLVREQELQPERTPLDAGVGIGSKNKMFSLQINAAYCQVSNQSVTLSDSGRLRLEYLGADRITLEADGSAAPLEQGLLKLYCRLQKTSKRNSNVQLPMNPFLQIQARAEYAINVPVTVWAAIDYLSPQNIDIDGKRKIDSYIRFGAGINSAILPQAVLAFEALNIFNTGYILWENYTAPGRQLELKIIVNIL